jgi:hypothetical protein
MTKKIFTNIFKSADTIAGAAFIIAILSVASRILGVFRDRILAGTFGAGQTLDLYYAAFRFPDLLFNLLVLGALSAGFIPIFSHLTANNQHHVLWQPRQTSVHHFLQPLLSKHVYKAFLRKQCFLPTKIKPEHKSLPTYGVGSEFSKDIWHRYIRELIARGYLYQTQDCIMQ